MTISTREKFQPAEKQAKRPALVSARSWLGCGMIYREFRTALTAMLVLALLDGLIVLLQEMQPRLMGGMVHSSVLGDYRTMWIWTGVFVALCLGVLCGAEEEERGTADFARRLPLTRERIFVEKLLGAGLAFAFWCVMAAGGIGLALGVMHAWPTVDEWRGFFAQRDLWAGCTWSTLLFSCGLAAAVATRRAMIGAVAGGVLAGALMMGNAYLANNRLTQMTPAVVWVAVWCAPPLIIAAGAVFISREGR